MMTIKKSQTGSVLIIVLIMLVMLTLIGTWAIRGSITSLKISTNAQAQSLLKQNSDSVFFRLENDTDDELRFERMRIGDGILSFVTNDVNKGKELVFCFRGNVDEPLEGSRIASVVYWEGTTIKNTDLGKNGFCQVGRNTDFISGRRAVLTQVSIRSAENINDWEHLYKTPHEKAPKSQRVVVTATSILPNLSSSSTTQVNNCLTNFTSFRDEVAKQDTVTDCLAKRNVPYSTQEMDYVVRPVGAS